MKRIILSIMDATIKNIGVIFLLFVFIAAIDTGIAAANINPGSESIRDSFYQSVNYNPTKNLLSFTIPKKIPKGYKFFLHISGRMYMGDKFNVMSFHAFDKESQNYSWKNGKTYTYPLESENLVECLMVFGLIDKNNQEFLYSIHVFPDGTKRIEKTDALEGHIHLLNNPMDC